MLSAAELFPGITSGQKPPADSSSVVSDTTAREDFIKELSTLITYQKQYDFIRYDQNYLEWDKEEGAKVFFDKLRNTGNKKLKIVHFGDSHVQADIFPGYVRNRLQEIFGEGGRGFVFPAASAGTHAAYDYLTQTTGRWENASGLQFVPKLDVGIFGRTVRTSDVSAGFKLRFSQKTNSSVIRIYLKKSPASYDIVLYINGNKEPLKVKADDGNPESYVTVTTDSEIQLIELVLEKNSDSQNFFECYGILLESDQDKGILYSSIGVNGGGIKSLLRQNLMPAQLKDYNPDAVLIDVGLNDFLSSTLEYAGSKNDLQTLILLIKQTVPDAAIIVINPMDFYYRGRSVQSSKEYAVASRDVAFANGCLFYDYYNVSGGRYSMQNWFLNRLSQWDRLHLQFAGYITKGELFLNAILGSMVSYSKNEHREKFIVENKVLEPAAPVFTYNAASTTDGKLKTFYKVKSGDILASVATKYGVTVNDIKAWNSLQGETIYSGQLLVIYSGNQPAAANISQVNDVSVSGKKYTYGGTTGEGNKLYHRVSSGETLNGIALKYGVSASQIMGWNNMQSSRIYAGNFLVIYSSSGSAPAPDKTASNPPAKTGDNSNTAKKNQTDNTKKDNTSAGTGTKIYYTIQKGDNLGKIAGLFGVTADELRGWNNISGDNITAGKSLLVYARKNSSGYSGTPQQNNTASKTPAEEKIVYSKEPPMLYTIKKGDTLDSISKTYNVPVSDIMSWNNISGNKIIAGKTLKIYKRISK